MSEEFPLAPPDPELVKKDSTLLSGLDDRTFLDQSTNKWVFEQDIGADGSAEYEFDFSKKKWVRREHNAPKGKRSRDEAQLDEEEQANKLELKRLKKERMAKLKGEIARLKKEQNERNNSTQENAISTAVYVTNLPSDITSEELAAAFSKYGLLAEDYTTGKPRVKLQYEKDVFKGEALIIYLKKESVALAVEMLDDTAIRPVGDKIKVSESQYIEDLVENKELTEEEKRLMKETNERMKEKVTNWDDERDEKWKSDKFNEAKRKILDKIVVVDKMFRVEDLQEDPLLEMDLKEDIQEECNKLGIGNDITKIIIENSTGRVKIKFKNTDSSSACIKNFNNRYFDGLKLVAHVEGDTKI